MHLGDIKNGSTQLRHALLRTDPRRFRRVRRPARLHPGRQRVDRLPPRQQRRLLAGRAGPERRHAPGSSRRDPPDLLRPARADPRRAQQAASRPRAGATSRTCLDRNAGRVRRPRHPGSNNDWLPWFEQPRTSRRSTRSKTGPPPTSPGWTTSSPGRGEGRKAVAIGIQADMWDPAIEGDPTQYDHFRRSCRSWPKALRFRGPVLLMNGDSHQFVDDHPLADPAGRRTSRSTGSHRTCRTCAGSPSTAAPRPATSG